MSAILVVMQHAGGEISKASLVALRAAEKLKDVWSKSELVGVVLGEGAAEPLLRTRQTVT